MFTDPPKITTVKINSINPKRLIDIYIELGIGFTISIDENGKNYYYYKYGDITYEIHLVENVDKSTKNATIRFFISDDLDGYCDILTEIGAEFTIINEKTKYRKVIIRDPDENFIELYETG